VALDFAQIIQSLNLGIIILDRDLRIVFWNRWMEEHSRMRSPDVVGRGIMELFPGLKNKGFQWKSQNVFKLGNYAFFSQQLHSHLVPLPLSRYLSSEFEQMQQNAALSPLRNDDGEVQYLCVTIEDATDAVLYREKLERAKQELETMSLTDPLTGLPNRRHLMETLEKEIARHGRGERTLSVAILDIDHFKAVNDTRGHLCGDHVLAHLGLAFRERLRTYDFVARYGGEEFCVVLANTPPEEAFLVMERLRENVASTPFLFEGKAVRLTLSVGLASSDGEGGFTLDSLLSRADEALYRAKAEGRNLTVLSGQSRAAGRSAL
jgi:diguanylate cyclase (GGDEF)-like protein